eukprot:Gregarina_sp_Poly_1__2164@NODE_1573_length_3817_cov_125_911200_g1040_i0_p1_GENE_NODE_1573_length_3817_cov_125_911200_g1040_i0NODE_1573_length_3817_cov_125_911200_g1040_i0_p1_ORF_typecomplete_len350_score34_91PSI/PF01437_25/0_0011PSI/PF01437_25/0_26PSI/PF01437_25/4_1e03TMIE/PF16038_5/0_23_NODE_1573_length_3817_cov_125_911200_g1040_i0581107
MNWDRAHPPSMAGDQRFAQRLQSFEVEARVLMHFHQRNMTGLKETDVAIMRYFCEQALAHRDCGTCIRNIVNSQFQFCGWCGLDNTCRAIIDTKKCASNRNDSLLGEHALFYPPFLHPSLCPSKRHYNRGALGCAANRDCNSCLLDTDCLWCSDDALPPDYASETYDEFFRRMAPGLFQEVAAGSESTGKFNFTRKAYDLFQSILEQKSLWSEIDQNINALEAGQDALKAYADVQQLRNGGRCIENEATFYLCSKGYPIHSIQMCEPSQKYLVTPVRPQVPVWNGKLLAIVSVPCCIVVMVAVFVQCFTRFRQQRTMDDWEAHMEEAAEKHRALKKIRRTGRRRDVSVT